MNLMQSNTTALPWVQVTLTVLMFAYIGLWPQYLTPWLCSILLYVCIGCFGISLGYHRLLTHKSFSVSRNWEIFLTLWGALAFTGSSIGWVSVHRNHHRYSDTEKDPHSPVHRGSSILIASYKITPDKWGVRQLITDRFHLFLHRYYFGLLTLWATLFFAFFGLTGLMHLVLIPAVISVWVSTVSNYMNHTWGYRNYDTRDNSLNNWFNALLTFGEGWHNNHHAYPGAWNFGHKWWELDIGAQIIKLVRTRTQYNSVTKEKK